MNQAAVVVDLGARGVFSFEFSEVGGLAIIHKRTLAKFGYRAEKKVE
jgi:hypothetical protein